MSGPEEWSGGVQGAKQLIFEQFALVGQALSSGHRLELLDLLVQGERSVDALARSAGLTLANASQHLLQLRRAGLVTSRREGKRVIYRLSDPQVWDVVRAVRGVAERNLAEVDSLVREYYTDRDSLEPVGRDELRARVAAGTVLVLDVRPAEEYAAGHVPGAVSIPLGELAERLDELPSGVDIVACCRGPYCVYSYDALELLRPNGFAVRRLDGGFSEWLAADLPVVRS
uniref:Putative HTH-type transcriptional regulator/MT0088 n=1 Tax=Mycobacterium riyadhense TaxID=486698 RepID=A0A653EBS5_9MYCO|nr:putative HTH-type transcriptional regulator/MT0088 [Mycobacterium riyadhense]